MLQLFPFLLLLPLSLSLLLSFLFSQYLFYFQFIIICFIKCYSYFTIFLFYFSFVYLFLILSSFLFHFVHLFSFLPFFFPFVLQMSPSSASFACSYFQFYPHWPFVNITRRTPRSSELSGKLKSLLSLLLCYYRSWAGQFTLYTTCTCPIMHLFCPPKFSTTFVFRLSWVLHPPQEKLKTMLKRKIWGGGGGVHHRPSYPEPNLALRVLFHSTPKRRPGDEISPSLEKLCDTRIPS